MGKHMCGRNRNTEDNLSFKNRKMYSLSVARQLLYDKDIIKRIKDAKTEAEIERAMSEGRRRL